MSSDISISHAKEKCILCDMSKDMQFKNNCKDIYNDINDSLKEILDSYIKDPTDTENKKTVLCEKLNMLIQSNTEIKRAFPIYKCCNITPENIHNHIFSKNDLQTNSIYTCLLVTSLITKTSNNLLKSELIDKDYLNMTKAMCSHITELDGLKKICDSFVTTNKKKK